VAREVMGDEAGTNAAKRIRCRPTIFDRRVPGEVAVNDEDFLRLSTQIRNLDVWLNNKFHEQRTDRPQRMPNANVAKANTARPP
jgi:hypothetical protein